MIKEINIEKALDFLRDTSEAHANAKALVKYLEQKRKTVKAIHFIDATGTIQAREAEAYTADEYKQLLDDYKTAVYDEQLLINQRKAAELKVEVWRSQNANMRRGNI